MYDIRLSLARFKPCMYWNGAKPTAWAKMLVKWTPALRLIAGKYRRNEFVRRIADAVRSGANNERSAQIRQVKLMYLNNTSNGAQHRTLNTDFCMVTDYLIDATSNDALK